MTLDARLFLAFSRVVHFFLRVFLKLEPKDYKAEEYTHFEYARRDGFFAKFPVKPDIRGRRVLDAGCGNGGETAAYAEDEPAAIVGIDLYEKCLPAAVQFAAEKNIREINFLAADCIALPFKDGSFDTIIMHDVFEHLQHPDAVLRECARVLAPGGRMYFSFGPLWHSPYGGHMFFFTLVPWAHLFVPERTIFNARSRYRSDGARSYEEVGIYKMTVGKFEKLLDDCPLKTKYLSLRASRGLSFMLKLPLLRELFCREIVCILEKE